MMGKQRFLVFWLAAATLRSTSSAVVEGRGQEEGSIAREPVDHVNSKTMGMQAEEKYENVNTKLKEVGASREENWGWKEVYGEEVNKGPNTSLEDQIWDVEAKSWEAVDGDNTEDSLTAALIPGGTGSSASLSGYGEPPVIREGVDGQELPSQAQEEAREGACVDPDDIWPCECLESGEQVDITCYGLASADILDRVSRLPSFCSGVQ